MRLRVTLNDKFSWIEELSPRVRSALFNRLLEEKFGSLSGIEAVATALAYVRGEEGKEVSPPPPQGESEAELGVDGKSLGDLSSMMSGW